MSSSVTRASSICGTSAKTNELCAFGTNARTQRVRSKTVLQRATACATQSEWFCRRVGECCDCVHAISSFSLTMETLRPTGESLCAIPRPPVRSVYDCQTKEPRAHKDTHTCVIVDTICKPRNRGGGANGSRQATESPAPRPATNAQPTTR